MSESAMAPVGTPVSTDDQVPQTGPKRREIWSKEEDALLIEAVQQHGERDEWKKVALMVPGRTNKACRKVHKIADNFTVYISFFSLALAAFSHSICQEIRLDQK